RLVQFVGQEDRLRTPVQRVTARSLDRGPDEGLAIEATFDPLFSEFAMPTQRRFDLAAAIVLATTASGAIAQSAATDPVSLSASLTGIGQLDARLDQGGKFSWNGVLVQGSAARQFTPEFS